MSIIIQKSFNFHAKTHILQTSSLVQNVVNRVSRNPQHRSQRHTKSKNMGIHGVLDFAIGHWTPVDQVGQENDLENYK